MAKRRIKKDRVIIAGVVSILFIFGVYKGVAFLGNKVMAIFQPSKQPVNHIEKEKEYIGTVILDPGHGDYDVGANKDDLLEKNITLKTAKFVGTALEKANIKAVYTREGDVALDSDKMKDLKMRAQMSAQHHAQYFISIHVNDFEQSNKISGFEVYTRNHAINSRWKIFV